MVGLHAAIRRPSSCRREHGSRCHGGRRRTRPLRDAVRAPHPRHASHAVRGAAGPGRRRPRACGEPIASAERRRLTGFLEASMPERDAVAWLAGVEADTLAALDRLGIAAAVELSRAVPALTEQFHVGVGKRWEGTVGLSTRLLFLMAAEWTIVRARPRGSWVSGQYRWSRLETWAPELPPPPSPAAARRMLVERWLATLRAGHRARPGLVERPDARPAACRAGIARRDDRAARRRRRARPGDGP